MNTRATFRAQVVVALGFAMAIGVSPAMAGRPSGGAHLSGHPALPSHPAFGPMTAQHVQAMHQMHAQMVQVQAHQMRMQQILQSEPMQAAGRAVTEQQVKLLTLANQMQAKARAINHRATSVRGLTAAQKQAQLQTLRNQVQAQTRAVERQVLQELSRMTPEQREAFMGWMYGGGPGWGTGYGMDGYYNADWAASFSGNY